jgi:hypothetical protein
MIINANALENKIREMYPEIVEHGMDVAAALEPATGEWLVRIGREGDEIATHVGAKDAEECLDGGRCMMLAAQLGSFVNDRCGSTTACTF